MTRLYKEGTGALLLDRPASQTGSQAASQSASQPASQAASQPSFTDRELKRPKIKRLHADGSQCRKI